MPCSICKIIGHNSRTCPHQIKSLITQDESIDIQLMSTTPIEETLNKKYFCYILQQTDIISSLNYVGYTVNYNRRIRQHNGIIKGGARFTKNRGPWQFLAVMTCSTWNNIRALQVEWLAKHPTRKRKRPKQFYGSIGRIKSLVEIFKRIPIEENITIYIHPSYYPLTLNLMFPSNVTIVQNLHDL